MRPTVVYIQRNTNANGSITYGLRWVSGINPKTGKDKWHRIPLFKTEPNPLAKRIQGWEQEAADARYAKERDLRGDPREFIVACPRDEAARQYVVAKDGQLADSTLDRAESDLARFNQYLDMAGGPVNVSGIRIQHVAHYRDYLAECGLAASTINCHLFDLSGWLRWCIGESYCADNPAKACNKLHVDSTRASLTVKSAADLWHVLSRMADDQQRATVGLLACTGLRIGEASRLTWDEWDRHNDTLHIGGAYHGKETTKRHKRVIPLCATASGFLRMLETINADGKYIIGSGGGRRRITTQANTWLSVLGISPKHLRQWFRTALETVEAPEYIIDDLLGHKAGKVRSAYTPTENLAASRPVIERFNEWLRAADREKQENRNVAG